MPERRSKPDPEAPPELKELARTAVDVDVSDQVMTRIDRMKRWAPWVVLGGIIAIAAWLLFVSELFTWGARELG